MSFLSEKAWQGSVACHPYDTIASLCRLTLPIAQALTSTQRGRYFYSRSSEYFYIDMGAIILIGGPHYTGISIH
jgi:hypothetical protein